MMWGATPLDQLACRIMFRRARYEGDFTPPGSAKVPSLQYPGNAGGQNWGSGAYDVRRNLLIVPEMRMPQTVSLIPSKKPEVSLSRAKDRPPMSLKARPYEARTTGCWARLRTLPAAAGRHAHRGDLSTTRSPWQVPTGPPSATDPSASPRACRSRSAPSAWAGPSPRRWRHLPRGPPPTLPARLRQRVGKVVWKARLPVGVGGHADDLRLAEDRPAVCRGLRRRLADDEEKGDYVIAFSLPSDRN
jgi:quinate dehydrogenase (quinone)